MLKQTLSRLNEQQREAAISQEPRILVIAGAGSGKTSVLTTRIANLQINERVGTSNMLALTFTRLAAKEMKERVAKLLGDSMAKKLTAGTFHSFCAKFLRQYSYLIDINSNFSVYDEEDRLDLLNDAIKDLGLTSKVKARNIDPWAPSGDYYSEQVASEYRYRLKRNNAIDLDGLLVETQNLLQFVPDIAEDIRRQYQYVFVDEYQDTDARQEAILNAINPQNLFVVGDPSQSIYGWRGAEIENILTFADRHQGCQVINLERNYRSTKPILDLANNIISKSTHKSPLKLWTEDEGQEPITQSYSTDDEEATRIAQEIKKRLTEGKARAEDYAILCRTNAQVALFGGALHVANVPSYIVSSKNDPLKAYDIRLAISWMSYICNPKDSRAFRRIMNWPERRLTDMQIYKLEAEAIKQCKDPTAVIMEHLALYDKAAHELELSAEVWASVFEMWEEIVRWLKLEERYTQQGLQNRVTELVAATESIRSWCAKQEALGESINPHTFLRWLAIRDIQERLAQESPDGVQIMTVHAAKGLEFDRVFIPGCNEGIFPSKKGDLEEERRLFYVAITRAKDELMLSYANQRTGWDGMTLQEVKPSPFLFA